MDEHIREIAELLKAMGNENRLQILCHLVRKPLTVSELCAKMPLISQSAMSQHLTVLKSNHIVAYEKKGQNITYSLQNKKILHIMETIYEEYCAEKE